MQGEGRNRSRGGQCITECLPVSSQCLLEGDGRGEGLLATSATGHDAFAQIANANAGFWFCSALSLSVYVSMGFLG